MQKTIKTERYQLCIPFDSFHIELNDQQLKRTTCRSLMNLLPTKSKKHVKRISKHETLKAEA